MLLSMHIFKLKAKHDGTVGASQPSPFILKQDKIYSLRALPYTVILVSLRRIPRTRFIACCCLDSQS